MKLNSTQSIATAYKLPTLHYYFISDFDLIVSYSVMMELQLSLALPGHNNQIKKDRGSPEPLWQDNKNYIKGKRSIEKAFGKMQKTTQKLPALVWSGQPNEEDDRNRQKKEKSCIPYKIDEEENKVVGWPPIKSWRRKVLHQQNDDQHPRIIQVEEENYGLVLNPVHVEVKIEDQRFSRDGSCCSITDQGNEGDWFLGGDVQRQYTRLMIMMAVTEHSSSRCNNRRF